MLLRAPFSYLQQVGPDSLVCALFSHFFGKPGDLIGGLGNVFGALNEGTLVTTATPHKAGHLCHQQGHSLSCTNDVVTLQVMDRLCICLL